MIPNHAQFMAAIQESKKVFVRYYSKPDSGVLNRICAPMDYGPGENNDGLNRYWLWNYSDDTGNHMQGLLPQQILDLNVIGEIFDPSQFVIKPVPEMVAPPRQTVVPSGGDASPVL